jgi:hypothetical protein
MSPVATTRPGLMQGIPKYEEAMNGALRPLNIIQETLNDIDHLRNDDDEEAVSI